MSTDAPFVRLFWMLGISKQNAKRVARLLDDKDFTGVDSATIAYAMAQGLASPRAELRQLGQEIMHAVDLDTIGYDQALRDVVSEDCQLKFTDLVIGQRLAAAD